MISTTLLLVLLSALVRKAPQSKWSCMDRPNVRNLLVQMDYGPMDRLCYVNLGRPNGRRSSGLPMLRQFGPSKWTMVQWTAYVTSILTVQMNDSPMDRPCYVNLDRPFGRYIGLPILQKFGPSKTTVEDRHFGPSKSTIVDRNIGPSKTTVVDRNFGRSKIMVGNSNFRLSKITV